MDSESPILSETERPAARVYNATGRSACVLVCEHASRFFPASLKNLGLDTEAQVSHAAWDIGALDVAKALALHLDAPLVAARVSRLVYDCNRPPDAPDAMPRQSERFSVPGNADLTESERAARVRDVFEPFASLVTQTLDRQHAIAEMRPTLITIHSFTPVFMGKPRNVDIGILHDTDTRLADAMLDCAPRHTSLKVGRNDPYGPEDGVTYSLRRHAISRGSPNVMIEIRNDLLPDQQACQRTAEILAGWLREALNQLPQTPGEEDIMKPEPPCPA